MLRLGPWFSSRSGPASAGGRGPRRYIDTHEVEWPAVCNGWSSDLQVISLGSNYRLRCLLLSFLHWAGSQLLFQLRVLLEVLPPQSGYGMASVVCVHIFHDQEYVFGEGWGKKKNVSLGSHLKVTGTGPPELREARPEGPPGQPSASSG